MAGLNISDYLSTVSGTTAPGNSSVSTLFSSLNQNNASGSATVAGINLSDYASIKNGSYNKLMKKYYTGEKKTLSDDELENYKKKLDVTSDKAAAFASKTNDLIDMDFSEDNREKVTAGINSFVDSYNSLLSNASSSNNSKIIKEAEWMKNLVGSYTRELSGVGISVDADGKLAVDKEKLAKADMTDLKSAFGINVNNFASKVLYKGEQIFSLAKTYGSSSNAYTSSGAYNRNYAAPASINTTL